MTNFAVWFLVIFAAMTAGEGYLLLGRQRILLRHAEQLLAVGANNVAKMPGKSAPRTGPDDTPTGPIALPPNPPLVQHTPAPEDDWRAGFTFKEPSQ